MTDGAHAIDWNALGWFGGWALAVGSLFVVGIRLPLAPARWRWWQRLSPFILFLVAGAIALLANLALTLHDTHFDLTRERIFTPARSAMAVIARLQQPVKITYFYRSDDPNAKRAKDILKIMARHNAYLAVTAVDPDKAPSLAANYGVKLYNAAVIEAAGRQVLVRGTDETEFAIGIERVLRERVVTVCFSEGHGEYASENYEFHTHLEGAVGHSHDDAGAGVVDTTQHGYGRLRRSLEGLGYVVQTISLAQVGGIPSVCQLVINAGPRTTYLPGETAAMRSFLAQGGAAWLMFDLGFVLEPGLADLLRDFGVAMPPAVVIDPQSHYGQDSETVAVTAYESHVITRDISYTFYPGVRPLELLNARQASPLVQSGARSYRQTVAEPAQRQIRAHHHHADHAHEAQTRNEAPQVLAAASEGRLGGAVATARVVVVGDADFASNSFYPYAANSDLALAMVRWLLREDHRPAIASRIPLPPVLILTKPQMQWVFAVVEVLLPALVGLLGVLVWWRRR